MTGSELRAWRTSRGLYQRDVVAILNAAGMEAVDQPTISEYERGILEVPAEADAALAAVAADYPVTGAPTPAPAPRKPKRERKSRDERAAEAAAAAIEPDDDELDEQPEAAADGEDEDRPPRAVPPSGKREQAARSTPWDAAVRTQLERDLRTLFAGDTFLVPVPVQMPDGSVVEHHEEAAVPGLAQIVGFADPYDGRVIEMNAPQMARAWAELADESPAVRRWLIMLTYGGAWRGVIAATLPVVYSIGVHHGIIPPVLGGGGAAPPRVAEAEPGAVPVG